MATLKLYDEESMPFLVSLITEMVAIPVRSRGEEIALHVATRDLQKLSDATGKPFRK
jgi:hypothetical protein